MGDRGVTPVEHAQTISLEIEVGRVKVIVLDGGRHSSRIKLSAKIRKAMSEVAQRLDLTAIEWKIVVDEILVPCGQQCKTHVGDPGCEVFLGMHCLPALEFGIAR